MIVCYHTQITKNWTDDDLHHKLALLPQTLQDKIISKRQPLDVQLSVTGILLLLRLIDHFKLDLKLDGLQYDEYQRPYFNGDFDFNISHSGNRVICCGATTGKVGIDIEQISTININYDDYFTIAEQQNIRAAKNTNNEVFKYWTRKEAVLKAAGTGIFTPLLDIDVSVHKVVFQDRVYHLLPIDIDADFAGCIACSVLQEVVLKELDV
ncbi:4'-phosphopantetheinyl transferase superfamily protein [Mucilaginibacter sp. dw_454]|uniref:4'-phosphopantetheinyl transferase family protein n=1 Tax=Mucilaginibacter sp. dw_454 TaxID=2720079 RepID=UPI001BD5F357|nr:4'-phosphopantetheinyl transferase superfamily protein [Mucilaginibacter sp. dw_454]